ncbi:hypothetical protein MMC07_000867 [Pseudocyphellaria aurata]|nr:hypothetical protein [Pseudocyphellaria aurata]
MDDISDVDKLEWLTSTTPFKTRAMINSNAEESWRAPKYRVTRFQRQNHRPSFGNFGKLPPELLCMAFRHLSCGDLEALHLCSTGGRMAVLAFPLYQTLLRRAPTIISVLKKTQLARFFTITQIYETFTSPLCTTCDHFGGYVFLPSFTRCCLHCAETKIKFMPLSPEGARVEYGVKGKRILQSLPHLHNIEGSYSTFHGQVKYYTQHLTLLSRELIEKVRDPQHVQEFPRQCRRIVGDSSIKAYQRYMTLTPLGCYIPESDSTERGVYCAGCDLRAKEHQLCPRMDIYGTEHYRTTRRVTDGYDAPCWEMGGTQNECLIAINQFRQHDSREILSHLEGCAAAQALLKVEWAESQELDSES